VAGGFDRSHSQQIKSVIIERHGEQLQMQAVADELPEVDIWGARRRAEFFERVFKTSLAITWQPTAASTNGSPGGDAAAAPARTAS
jgi:exopolyphosphatase/guanosine-5'-triphosphate,3'-diphosphate pyrophosphatase